MLESTACVLEPGSELDRSRDGPSVVDTASEEQRVGGGRGGVAGPAPVLEDGRTGDECPALPTTVAELPEPVQGAASELRRCTIVAEFELAGDERSREPRLEPAVAGGARLIEGSAQRQRRVGRPTLGPADERPAAEGGRAQPGWTRGRHLDRVPHALCRQRQVAALPGEEAGPHQRALTILDRDLLVVLLVFDSQHGSEHVVRQGDETPPVPVPREPSRHADGRARTRVESEADREGEVVRLGVGATEPCELLGPAQPLLDRSGQERMVSDESGGGGVGAPGRAAVAPREPQRRRRDHEARARRRRVGAEQRTTRQVGEVHREVLGGRARDRTGCLGNEGAGEERQFGERPPPVGGEQRDRPVERRVQARMAARDGLVERGERVPTGDDASADLLERCRERPGSGELDRERQAVDRVDDRGDGREFGAGRLETGAMETSPIDEELHTITHRPPVVRREGRQGRDGQPGEHDLHLAREAERLVTGDDEAEAGAAREELAGEVAHGAGEAIAAVEDEHQLAVWSWSTSRSIASRAGSSLTPVAAATAPRGGCPGSRPPAPRWRPRARGPRTRSPPTRGPAASCRHRRGRAQ